MPQNLDSKYQFLIQNASGQTLLDATGYAKNRQFTLARNRAGEASFAIDYYSLESLCRTTGVHPRSILGVGINQLLIKRRDVPLFGGQIAYYEGALERDNNEIVVKALGWFELLKDRYTSALVTYTGIDAGLIAWDLIDDTQMLTNGSFGITQGTIQTSVNRTRTYEYKNIKEAIIQLSEVLSGFDFEITWDKKFNVYYPNQGATRTEFKFIYPGNIKQARVISDASQLVNKVTVRGQGYGLAQVITNREDTTTQASYKLRQAIADYSDVVEVATLEQLGDEMIRIKRDPVTSLELTLDGNLEPYIGAYAIGDRVPVEIKDTQLYDNLTGSYRIDEIGVTIDDNDSEDIVLRVSL